MDDRVTAEAERQPGPGPARGSARDYCAVLDIPRIQFPARKTALAGILPRTSSCCPAVQGRGIAVGLYSLDTSCGGGTRGNRPWKVESSRHSGQVAVGMLSSLWCLSKSRWRLRSRAADGVSDVIAKMASQVDQRRRGMGFARECVSVSTNSGVGREARTARCTKQVTGAVRGLGTATDWWT
jgi:hypothetical protein